MNKIYIFDSLTHPCVLDQDLDDKLGSSFQSLQDSMQGTMVKWACAVGLSRIGAYDHEKFITRVKQYSNLVAIAGLDPQEVSNRDLAKTIIYLKRLMELGFKGIKLHPRYCEFSLNDDVINIFKAAEALSLPVFYCTYHWGSTHSYNQFQRLNELLSICPKIKLVLVHGGGVELLNYMELARAFRETVLLDLSLTILKYENSSIDMDLRFLFEKFDRRICVGTDHPQFSHQQLSDKFLKLSKDIDPEKTINIAYKNLKNFLEIEDAFFNV